MFELKNKSTVTVNAKTVHKIQRHRAHFHPSEHNNGTHSSQILFTVLPIDLTNPPQKLFTLLPIDLIIDIYNWCFTLRYVSSKNLVSHNYHKHSALASTWIYRWLHSSDHTVPTPGQECQQHGPKPDQFWIYSKIKFRKDYTYTIHFIFKMTTFNLDKLRKISNSTWKEWTHHTYYKHEVMLCNQAVVTSVIPALQSISHIKYKNIGLKAHYHHSKLGLEKTEPNSLLLQEWPSDCTA
jgi:hypothetical protein